MVILLSCARLDKYDLIPLLTFIKACERGIWGPHLVVVPTSVLVNWETEFKKFAPAFKIMTYFGSQKDRKLKRYQKPNAKKKTENYTGTKKKKKKKKKRRDRR